MAATAAGLLAAGLVTVAFLHRSGWGSRLLDALVSCWTVLGVARAQDTARLR